MLGSIQYLQDHDMLLNTNMYVGCSIGSLIAYLLILGFNANEILSKIISEKILDNFSKINLIKLSKGLGCSDWKSIDDFLLNMTFEKSDQPLTFQDLYLQFGKKLVCTTFNTTTNTVEYLSIDTTPKLLCSAGIRMSANVPLLFNRYKYNNCHYIDGGIVENFPIKFAITCKDIKSPNIIGVDLFTGLTQHQKTNQQLDNTELYEDGEDDITQYNVPKYIGELLSILLSYHCDKFLNTIDQNKMDLVRLNPKINPWQFVLSSKEMLDIFSDGYQNTLSKFV